MLELNLMMDSKNESLLFLVPNFSVNATILFIRIRQKTGVYIQDNEKVCDQCNDRKKFGFQIHFQIYIT